MLDKKKEAVRVGDLVTYKGASSIIVGIVVSVRSDVDFPTGERTEDIDLHLLAVNETGSGFWKPMSERRSETAAKEMGEVSLLLAGNPA